MPRRGSNPAFSGGVFTDAGLRTHELFSPDGRVAERRRTRFFALAVAAAIGLVGAGVAARVSAEVIRSSLTASSSKSGKRSRRARGFSAG